jgi:hypothetical protein
MAKVTPAQPKPPSPVPPPGRDQPSEQAVPQPDTRVSTPFCQLCGTPLFEIHGKLQCPRCRTIWESCCEGGRWP